MPISGEIIIQHKLDKKSPKRLNAQRVEGYDSLLQANMYLEKRLSPHKKFPSNQSTLSSLSWRLNPVESLSDWTLVVVSSESAGEEKPPPRTTECDQVSEISDISGKNEELTKKSCSDFRAKATKRYHVHRAVLGVGKRKADFFAEIFQRQRLALENNADERDLGETKDLQSITHLEVKPSAAAAFDTMLDFMYAPDSTTVKATTESAVALRHLSIALGARELFNSVTPFIQKDLSAQTSPIYVFEAFRYNHEKLLNVAMKICASNFSEIKLSSIIILTPNLFGSILRSPHLKCQSEVLSSRVASYFRCRPKSITAENLLRFTSPDVMPSMASDEVLFYLNMMEQTGLILKKDRRNVSLVNSSLYQRCVLASTETLQNLMEEKLYLRSKGSIQSGARNKQASGELEFESLSSRIRSDLLENALLEKISKTQTSSPRIKKDEKRNSNASEKTRRIRRNKPLSRHTLNDYEEKILMLEEKLAARDHTIEMYSSEISKFTRLPNNYTPPLNLSDYTYKRDPIYDSYGASVYGLNPPTAMPNTGHQEYDGWVCRDHKLGDDVVNDKIWPLYYYKG